MLALQPQQPAQPTRRAIPLSRSSSSLRKTAPAPTSTRQPFSSIQPGQPARDTDTLSALPAKVSRGQREEAPVRTRPSSTIAPQPPLAPSSRTVQSRQRVESKQEVRTEREAQQPEPQEDDKGKEQAAAKSSRNKLTDQWDEPPTQIRRGAVHLERGRLLGEVRDRSARRGRTKTPWLTARFLVGRLCEGLPVRRARRQVVQGHEGGPQAAAKVDQDQVQGASTCSSSSSATCLTSAFV